MTRLRDRWTIRARLTALTASLVLIAGTLLVLGGWWWLASSLPDAALQVSDGAVFVTLSEGEPIPVTGSDGVVGKVPDQLLVPSDPTPVSEVRPAATVDLAAAAVRIASENLAAEVARRAGLLALVLLGLLTVAAVAIGWFAAKRALAPVHAMTDAARRLEGSSLSARLPVGGPRDEVRELGETFNEMLDRVEGSVRREQRLLADVSHELRTPLANQRIVLELALEGAAPDDDGAVVAAARTAVEQNVRAHRLIEQMLLLARIEQGESGPRDDEEVGLLPLVERLSAAPALAALGPPGVSVAIDSAGSPIVRGEPVLVERMVGNLVENAVRHNVAGGEVRIEVAEHDGRAEVLVSNTGPTVDPDGIDALFAPFRRGAPSAGSERVRSQDGVGLGLSVVAAIARRYGVELHASARTGGGLDVRLRWPATG